MAEEAIPGLAVALVDGDEALWVEGFGPEPAGTSATAVAASLATGASDRFG